LPDDPRHLVAVQFDDRILHLDLRHAPRAFLGRALRGGAVGRGGRAINRGFRLFRPASGPKARR
jgi:hypothetical protein